MKIKTQYSTPLFAIALLGALSLGRPVSAQDSTTTTTAAPSAAASVAVPAAPEEPKGKHHGERFEKMVEALGLTDEQKPKVKAAMEEQMASMKEIHQDTTLTPEEKKAKMKPVHEKFMETLKSILTPEQLKKMKEMRKQHEHKPAA